MSRYPKRKLAAVSYLEDTDDAQEIDEEWRPGKKARTSTACKSTSKNAVVRRKEKPFRFLDLPGELRNKIYTEVLCTPMRDVHIRGDWARQDHLQGFVPPMNVGLLRTCKLIHQEATGILYEQQFIFHLPTSMLNFLSRLGPATAGLLRHLECLSYVYTSAHQGYLPTLSLLLQPATNLEYLRIPVSFRRRFFDKTLGPEIYTRNMTVAGWDSLVGRNLARQLYTGMHPYLQIALRNIGANKTMSVAHVFDAILDNGPIRSNAIPGDCSFRSGIPNRNIKSAEWTPARSAAMRAAMGEELARLVARDTV